MIRKPLLVISIVLLVETVGSWVNARYPDVGVAGPSIHRDRS